MVRGNLFRELSFAERVIILKDKSPLVKLISVYKNDKNVTFCVYICKCGKENIMSWSHLSSGKHFCKECSGKATTERQTPKMEDVVILMSKINPNIKLLDRKHFEKGKKGYSYHCSCLIDGCEWWCLLKDLKNGHGCPRCGNNFIYSFGEIKEIVFNLNDKVKIIDGNYINSNSILIFRCEIDGYEWKSTIKYFRAHSKCPICNGTYKPTLNEVVEMVENKFENIEVLNKDSKCISTKLKCRCKIDGNEWTVQLKQLLKSNGFGCRECTIRNTKLENHPSWKGGLTPLNIHVRANILPWKIDSFRLYNNKCDITKTTTKTIIHHHKNFSEILKEALKILNILPRGDISNYNDIELKKICDLTLELHYKYDLGVCLSVKEHILFHKIYTNRNNTLEQYTEFKKMRINEIENNKFK